MGTTELNERVAVLAKFEGGKAVPVLLRWRGRRYRVESLNLHHRKPEGTDVIHYYAVTTEAGDCTLAYSQNDLSWKLCEVSFSG